VRAKFRIRVDAMTGISLFFSPRPLLLALEYPTS